MMENDNSENSMLPKELNLELNFAITGEELIKYKEEIKKQFVPSSSSALPIIELDITGVYIYPAVYHTFSHWALLIGNEELCHLVFVLDKQTKAPLNIRFASQMFDPSTISYKKHSTLGLTKYTISQIRNIGKMLISNFGTYHHVFWNCQNFANCLLDIICDSKYEKIKTSAAVLRGLMFGTILSSPTATTRVIQENKKQESVVSSTKKDLAEKLSDTEIMKEINVENNVNEEKENIPCCLI